MPATITQPRARQAAERAIALDESLGEAYATLALTLESETNDWDEAERLYLKSFELNPNYSLAHEWYSSLLVGTGRFEEGLREIRRAEELDPLSLRGMMFTAWSYYQTKRFNEAIGKARQIIEFNPNYGLGHFQLGNALLEVGEPEQAIAAIRESARLMAGAVLPMYVLCFALVALGRREEAEQVRAEMQTMGQTQHVKDYFQAMADVALGDYEVAFERLNRTLTERDSWLVWFGTEPKLDPIRSDPRFIEIFRATGNPLAMKC
jgi:tetratricopeptide (TPR) repeat protein